MLTNEPKKNITRKEHATLRFKIFVFFPERDLEDGTQSSVAFDRATRLSSSKSHAEVRNQIVLVLVVVLVLEGRA